MMVARSNHGLGREVGYRIDTESDLMVDRSDHGLRRKSTRVGHRIDTESGLVVVGGCWLGGTCRYYNI